jgi:hypothetical protein
MLEYFPAKRVDRIQAMLTASSFFHEHPQATNTTRRLRHFADAVPSISHLTVLALLLGKGNEAKRSMDLREEC